MDKQQHKHTYRPPRWMGGGIKDELMAMVRDGASYASVAAHFHTTKNAVAGAVWRERKHTQRGRNSTSNGKERVIMDQTWQQKIRQSAQEIRQLNIEVAQARVVLDVAQARVAEFCARVRAEFGFDPEHFAAIVEALGAPEPKMTKESVSGPEKQIILNGGGDYPGEVVATPEQGVDVLFGEEETGGSEPVETSAEKSEPPLTDGARVLNALRELGGAATGRAVAEKAGLSIDSVWAHLSHHKKARNVVHDEVNHLWSIG